MTTLEQPTDLSAEVLNLLKHFEFQGKSIQKSLVRNIAEAARQREIVNTCSDEDVIFEAVELEGQRIRCLRDEAKIAILYDVCRLLREILRLPPDETE